MKKIFNMVSVFFLVFLIAIFGLKDTIIKSRIEKEMTKELGTNVRIYGVDYSIFKNFLELKKIEIEDISSIEKMDIKLNFSDILSKRIKIKDINVQGLEFSEDKVETLLNLGKLTSEKVQSKLENKTSDNQITSTGEKNSDKWIIEIDKIEIQAKLFNENINVKMNSSDDSKIDFRKFIDFVKKNVIDEKN